MAEKTAESSPKEDKGKSPAVLTPGQYGPKTDVYLLRECVTRKMNPDGIGRKEVAKWKEITSKINKIVKREGKVFNDRQTRERAKQIHGQFKKSEAKSKKDSGPEEEYDERKQLLTEWVDILEDGHDYEVSNSSDSEEEEPKKKKMKEETKSQKKKQDKLKLIQGEKIRDAAMKTLKEKKKAACDEASALALEDEENENPDDEESVPPALSPQALKSSKRGPANSKKKGPAQDVDSVFEYLAKQNELRKEELEIRKQELNVERERQDKLMELLASAFNKK